VELVHPARGLAEEIAAVPSGCLGCDAAPLDEGDAEARLGEVARDGAAGQSAADDDDVRGQLPVGFAEVAGFSLDFWFDFGLVLASSPLESRDDPVDSSLVRERQNASAPAAAASAAAKVAARRFIDGPFVPLTSPATFLALFACP
jgi:hypothetical protein